MLNELAQEIHRTAREKGWWSNDRQFPEVIALCHSELSEALEEYRNGRPNEYHACMPPPCAESHPTPAGHKPEGVGVELADCIIRILDACAKYKIDIEGIIRRKMAFNKTRPYRHGEKQA